MSLATEQVTDLAEIFDDLGESFTFGAATVPCAPSFRDAGRKNEMGGFLDDFDATFTARIVDLPGTPPVVGDKITHRTRVYRIERIGRGQTEVEIRYLCTASNR